MVGRLQQIPRQPLGMRPDRLTQGRRVLSQLPRDPGPKPADALTGLDNDCRGSSACHRLPRRDRVKAAEESHP